MSAIWNLPVESFLGVFSYLSITELSSCARVCKAFANLTGAPSLWTRFAKKAGMDIKSVDRERYKRIVCDVINIDLICSVSEPQRWVKNSTQNFIDFCLSASFIINPLKLENFKACASKSTEALNYLLFDANLLPDRIELLSRHFESLCATGAIPKSGALELVISCGCPESTARAIHERSGEKLSLTSAQKAIQLGYSEEFLSGVIEDSEKPEKPIPMAEEFKENYTELFIKDLLKHNILKPAVCYTLGHDYPRD